MNAERADREWEAAKRLVSAHAPAGLLLRLSSDDAGQLRLRLEGIEGVNLQKLAGAVDRSDTIGRT
jgi:hypothetical protein